MFERQPAAAKNVDIASLEAYRHTGWDLDGETESLSHLGDELLLENCHLWSSDEQTQVLAVATWVAASRQHIAERLLHSGEEQSGKPGVVARDIAQHASVNFHSAQEWVRFRDTVSVEPPDYRLEKPLATQYEWPKVEGTASKALLTALYETARVGIYLDLESLKGAYEKNQAMPRQFYRYLADVESEQRELQLRLQSVERMWNSKLDPRFQAGASAVDELTSIIEGTLWCGSQMLMPYLRDPDLRLKNFGRQRAVGQQSEVGAFDPTTLKRPERRPDVSGFDPNKLARPAQPAPAKQVQPGVDAFRPPETKKPAVSEPNVGAFDPSTNRPPTQPDIGAFNPTARPAEQIKPFNPAAPKETQIGAFDPSRRSQPERPESDIPKFNPNARKLDDDGTIIEVFDPRGETSNPPNPND